MLKYFKSFIGFYFKLFKPFSKRQILHSSKLKEFAYDNFNSDENGRKFFKRIENNVGKGEIARNEQFLFFQQSFQKTYTTDMWKPGFFWERVKEIEFIYFALCSFPC